MKKLISLSLVLLVLLTGCYRAPRGETEDLPFSGGAGTETDPYRISTEADLREMQTLINGKETHDVYTGAWFALTADIALGKKEWEPIHDFSGVLDGGGHTISGMHMEYSGSVLEADISQLGFIGTLRGAVKDLTFRDCSVVCRKENSGEAGVVAGRVASGTITNCHVTGTSEVVSGYYAGGICGNVNGESALASCTNAAAVTGSGNISGAGGIAGRVVCLVSECSNTGTIAGEGDAAGIACVSTGGVANCTNTGTVTAAGCAGGIVVSFDDGALNHSQNNPDVELRGCSNSGTVLSTGDPAGGIAVGCRTGSIIDCVNSGAVSSPEEVGGIFAYFQPSVFGEPCAYFRVIGCTNTGAVTNTEDSFIYPVGGICGRIYDCPTDLFFEKCENLGALSSGAQAGGIVGDGRFRTLTLRGCVNLGAVQGAEYVGGLVGEIRPMNTELEETTLFHAENCRNAGDIYGEKSQGYDGGVYVGGILGYINELTADTPFTEVIFDGCENSGSLTGSGETRVVYADDLCGSYAAE